jgi:RimJ/RimL family protein N-acetyltransferase
LTGDRVRGSDLQMQRGEIIHTRRLRIVPFAEEYLTPRYVDWLNDPDVMRYSEQRHRRHTMESCRDYWLSFAGTPHHFWAIVVSEGGLGHIGNINAYIDEKNRLADVGILIGEKTVWGQGYGLEAWRAVCSHLLEAEGLRKVTAGTVSANKGMLRIMEKSGMVDDGCRRRHFLFESREVDVVHGALFSERQEKEAGPK